MRLPPVARRSRIAGLVAFVLLAGMAAVWLGPGGSGAPGDAGLSGRLGGPGFRDFLGGPAVASASSTRVIRVGLVEEASVATVGGTAGAVVLDVSGATVGRVGSSAAVTAAAGGVVSVAGVGTVKGPVTLVPAASAAGQGYVTVSGRPYRGELQILSSGGLLTVVNELPLEEYLLGVVAKEMPDSFPLEAMKAQAVAARTYALYQIMGGAYRARGFDVRATTDSQVYGGVWDERPKGNTAVQETAGEIVTYNGQPIAAYYFSSSGGYTESAEFVWGRKSPYLKGVPDYDQASPKYTWTVYVTRETLIARLTAAGYGVGTVRSIEGVGAPGPGGRYLYQRITGSQGSVTIRSDRLRQIMNLNSAKFDFFAREERMDNLTSTLDAGPVVVVGAGGVTRRLSSKTVPVFHDGRVEDVTIDGSKAVYPVKVPASFSFEGRGYGHGLGLSQYGARGLALQGKTYRDILTYYYTGVSLGTIP